MLVLWSFVHQRLCCSKGNVEDKILVAKLPKNCARYRHPVDGPYCQGCSLLRKKLKEDLVTYFPDFQNTSESSNDSTNVVNAPRDPFVVKQDHGELAKYINTPGWNRPAFYNNGDDDDVDYTIAITPDLSTEEPDNSLSMGDEHLDTILKTKSDEIIKSSVEDLAPIPSESEGIPDTMCDVHLINNPTPLKAKDYFEIVINSNDDIYSSDDDYLYNENIEYVEASPHDSKLVSLEVAKIVILEDKEIEDDNLREKLLNVNLLIAKIEALKDNPTPSFEFLTKSSSTSPDSFLEETNTFHNSLPEFENFCFDLEEISSGRCALLRKEFKEDLFTYCIENRILQNSSEPSNDNTNIANALQESFVVEQDLGKNSSQSPPQINHYCCFECGDSLEDIFCHKCTCELCGREWETIIEIELAFEDNHCQSKDILELFQRLHNDVQNIHEELAMYINTPNWGHPTVSYDDDDEDYAIAVTLSLSTAEPDNSLSMGDEHLDTISATESDEFIKSSVESLVPIPSESEGIPDNMCDMPFHDNSLPFDVSKDQFKYFSDSNDESTSTDDDSFSINNIEYVEASPPNSELVSSEVMEIVISEVGGIDDDILLTIKDDILHEKLLNVNLLIANIEALNDNPTPSFDFMTKSSSTSLNSLLEETNTFNNSFPEFEIFCFDLEEISSGSITTRFDISLPEYEAFYDDHVKEISSGSTTTRSDFSLYDSFIFDLSINPFPPTNRSDFYMFGNELAHIISPPESDCFYFKNEPNSGDFTMDVVEDIFLTKELRIHDHNVLPTHPTLQLNLDFILSSESFSLIFVLN
nr:hypothetical protein [Tanacetum cinerariifolium]